MSRSISIIIPICNKWNLTYNCLKSLNESHNKIDYDIIIVDNGSTDETVYNIQTVLNKLFNCRHQYIRNNKNLNFARACNIGAKASKNDIILFLNNDTLITDNCLDEMVEKIWDSKKITVSPILVYPEFSSKKNRIQHLGIAFEPRFYPRHLYEFFPITHPVCKKERQLQCVTAAALMLYKNDFLEVGGFDERFINGGEDVALGLRLTNLGFRHLIVNTSIIYHFASQTPGIHDNAEHNASVLKNNYIQLIKPDLSYIVDDDGYNLCLTPSLKVYISLKNSRKLIIDKIVERTNNIVDIEDIIDKEPICFSAYKKAIKIYRDNNKYIEMSNTLQLLLKFYPHPEIAKYVISKEEYIYNINLIKEAHSISDWYSNHNNYKESFNIAKSMCSFYKNLGIIPLYKLYDDWINNSVNHEEWYYKYN